MHNFHIKSKVVVTILISLFSIIVTAQDVTTEISKIKEWYAEIENNPGIYIQKDLTNFMYIDGCNVTVSYWKDAGSDQYVKIIANASRDWLEIETIYYFKDGKLFFVFESGYNVSEWYTPEELGITAEELYMMGGEAKVLEYYEHRIYFANETCIRFLEKRKAYDAKDENVDLSSVQNKTLEISKINFSELKEQAQEYVDFIIGEDGK